MTTKFLTITMSIDKETKEMMDRALVEKGYQNRSVYLRVLIHRDNQSYRSQPYDSTNQDTSS